MTGDRSLKRPDLDAVIAGVCAGSPRTIVLDLRGVTFMDSGGLHSLIKAHDACRQDGHDLQIIPGPENVQRLFQLTGTADMLPFIDGNGLNGARPDESYD
jgi:anti-sigma B factor antagonist